VLWWGVVLGLSLATGLLVESGLSRARAEAERFGPPVPVVVARRDLAAGARLGPENVELRDWPTRLVPERAVTSLPVDGVAATPVHAGEPIIASRVAPNLLPPGRRALALPAGPGNLGVRAGDEVDVLATFDPLVTPAGEDPTVTVARAATVVAVRSRAITVAVTEVEAPRVAFALSQATLTLALTPPGTVAGDG
jgi:Flp pilus assembly protein CpaB